MGLWKREIGVSSLSPYLERAWRVAIRNNHASTYIIITLSTTSNLAESWLPSRYKHLTFLSISAITLKQLFTPTHPLIFVSYLAISFTEMLKGVKKCQERALMQVLDKGRVCWNIDVQTGPNEDWAGRHFRMKEEDVWKKRACYSLTESQTFLFLSIFYPSDISCT